MINETSIRCFLQVCETLNFTQAAKQLYMTQQSVSKYIARLEEELGVQLFERTHHYVRPTEAGETLYQLFSGFEREFRTVLAQLQDKGTQGEGRLRFGYLEWLDLAEPLSAALREVERRLPGVQVRGEKQPRYELNKLFSDGELDLIITYREFAPWGPGIVSAVVLETPLVLLVSPKNPLVKPGAKLSDFAREPFIKAAASGERRSETRQRALRQCREMGFSPREILISPNLESGYLAVEMGQGVLVSTQLSRISLSSGLVSFPVGSNEQLMCFWHENAKNKAAETFAACLEAAGGAAQPPAAETD